MPTDTATPRPVLPFRHVLAVVLGNALEFYDFLTYAFFAVQIGRTFFPNESANSSLLLSLATFGAGFITRPLGGVVIGMMGDRVGRKPAMLLSFSLMGIAIVGLALTPSYNSIGVAAPILVLCFRLLQGFSLGGEVGPTTAYMIEAAPPNRRALYASMQGATQDFAVLCAGLIGVVLANLLDADTLQNWGWRIAFLIGAAIIPFGLIARSGLMETLEQKDGAEEMEAHPDAPTPWRIALLGLCLLGSGTICTYVMTYLATYATDTLGMPSRLAFGATVVVGLCGLCLDPVSGWLSDRFGRKPIMFIPTFLLFLAAYPAFLVISHYRTETALLSATAVLACLSALGQIPILTALTESLPRRIRSGSLAIIYAVAIATFGGTTQFMLKWLIDVTGNPQAPGFYMMGAIAFGLVGIVLIPESAPAARHKR
ncbi:MAG TPA: MFS transporter [Aliidongia sp.]|nr:MFS transporter [Aliidongia sp.]